VSPALAAAGCSWAGGRPGAGAGCRGGRVSCDGAGVLSSTDGVGDGGDERFTEGAGAWAAGRAGSAGALGAAGGADWAATGAGAAGRTGAGPGRGAPGRGP